MTVKVASKVFSTSQNIRCHHRCAPLTCCGCQLLLHARDNTLNIYVNTAAWLTILGCRLKASSWFGFSIRPNGKSELFNMDVQDFEFRISYPVAFHN